MVYLQIIEGLGSELMRRSDNHPTRHSSRVTGQPRIVAVLVLVLAVSGAYFAYDRYEASRLADSVRRLFAARRYDDARGLVQRWIRERPRSGEAQYYRVWLALVDQQPSEAVEGMARASRLGFDPGLLRPLHGIFQARGGHISAAEPILREAFDQQREPRTEVARELRGSTWQPTVFPRPPTRSSDGGLWRP